jgi:hypothetical protein
MARWKTWHSFGIATGLAFSLVTGFYFSNRTVSLVFYLAFMVLLKTTLKIRRQQARAGVERFD